MRIKNLGFIIAMLVMALFVFAPTVVFAEETKTLDSLVHQIDQTDIGAWFQFIVAVGGAFLFLRKEWRTEVATGKKSRWDFITGAIPYIHGQAQKAASTFKGTNKAVAFIEYMDAFLRSAEYDALTPDEKVTVAALGSGEHQTFKAIRDAGVVINGDISPLPSPPESLED